MGTLLQFQASTDPQQLTGRVVALSGWRGSGKDTTADVLVSQFQYKKLSFAAALKDMVADMYNLPRSILDDRDLKDKGISGMPVVSADPFSAAIHDLLRAELAGGYWTPRALCILEGSIKRAVNTNYWVSRIIQEIRKNPDQRYVISDMRYTSEAETLKKHLPARDLIAMRIDRFDTIDTLDASERDLDDYEFSVRVSNYGSMPDLQQTVLEWASAFLATGPR